MVNINAIKSSLDNFMAKNNIFDSQIDALFDNLSNVFGEYDNYSRDSTDQERRINFSESISDFVLKFYEFKDSYTNNVNLLTSNHQEIFAETDTLDIQLLDVDLSLEDFWSKLKSISIIYEQLKLAIYPDKTVPNLEIIKRGLRRLEKYDRL